MPGELLRLRAEMRLPGEAWLELRVRQEAPAAEQDPSAAHGPDRVTTVYGQRAVFVPRGLAGHAYWWTVAPFHGTVFGQMARRITREARGRTAVRQRGTGPRDSRALSSPASRPASSAPR